MAQPTPYERQYSFTDYQTENPADPLPGDQVDAELNAVKQTLDQTLNNIELIQRDDGALANESVGIDQLKPEIDLGINSVTEWDVGVDYVPRDGVFHEGSLYRCLEAHTSTVFADDLADEFWQLILDVSDLVEETTDDYLDTVAQPYVDDAEAAAAAAATSASEAASSASAASTSATTATTQATNASTSATNASNSASAASTSASSASTSATNASTSASNASTSASAAAASATAAAATVASALWRDVVFKTFADTPVTVSSSDNGKLFSVDTSGGNVVFTLPQISGLTLPFNVGFKKTTADVNTITLNRGGTDTIDGDTSKSLGSADSGTVLIADVEPAPDLWTSADFGAVAGNVSVDRFSGDGAEDEFTLSTAPGSENNTWVYVAGVYQQKDTYSVSGTTLTFSAAPPLGTDNIEVIIGTLLSIGAPADGTVTAAKIDDGDAAAIREVLELDTWWVKGISIENVATAIAVSSTLECMPSVPVGFKIVNVRTDCTSGTCTATFKINSTALGGSANSVSSTATVQPHASNNTAAAGDTINVTISSNSTCLGLIAWFELEEV